MTLAETARWVLLGLIVLVVVAPFVVFLVNRFIFRGYQDDEVAE